MTYRLATPFLLFLALLVSFAVFALPAAAQSALPIVTIVVTPTEISFDERATVIWSSAAASSCSVTGTGLTSRAKTGSATITLETTSTYTITCLNSAGSTSAIATITVIPQPLPTINITANPIQISKGETSTLSWNSSNADRCFASGGWSGSKADSGNTSVRPTKNTNYTIICINSSGSASDNATVQMERAVPSVTLNISSGTITQGQSVTLSWQAKNSNSCSAAGGWSGLKTFSGSETFSPTITTNYSLTCANEKGTDSKTKTVSVRPSVVVASSGSGGGAATIRPASTPAPATRTSLRSSGALSSRLPAPALPQSSFVVITESRLKPEFLSYRNVTMPQSLTLRVPAEPGEQGAFLATVNLSKSIMKALGVIVFNLILIGSLAFIIIAIQDEKRLQKKLLREPEGVFLSK